MDKDEKSLIEKVTENNESPAPGWALDQMARLTMQKPGIEMEMVELLYKRLTKNSCDVKLKTLRAMHFISRRGSVAFRRAMQRGSQQIRVHLTIQGNPHPVHGDAPWRFIRDTAKEVMNAIHDTSQDDAPVQTMKKMEGFGGGGGGAAVVDDFRNTPSGGGQGAAGAGGVGNFDARGQPGGVAAFMNKATEIAGANQFGAKAMEVAGGAVAAVGFGGPGADSYGAAAGGPGGMPGQPGAPGAAAPAQDGWGQGGTTSAQHQQAQATVKSSMPQRIKVEAGEYEAKIIDDLCEPSGARPNPSKEVLAKFVQQCGSLDANLCCALLEEKLEDEDWKVVLKALVGICSLVEKGKEGVVEYFGEGNDEFIKEIATDPESQKSLRLAAEKCAAAIEKAQAPDVVDDGTADMFSGMMSMDEPAPTMDVMGGAAPVAAAPAGGMDLSFMGAMGGPVSLAVPSAAAAPEAAAPAPPVDPMFAGVGAAAPAPAPPAGGMDLLSGFGAPAAAAPAMGGMGALAPAMGGMMGAPAPAAAAPGGMDLMGMFGAPAPAPPMGGGMMGGMGAAPAGGMMGGMPPVGIGAQPMGGQMQMPGMGQPQQQMGGMQMGGMPQMGAPAPAPAPAGAFDFLG